jgi:hypothetical protein
MKTILCLVYNNLKLNWETFPNDRKPVYLLERAWLPWSSVMHTPLFETMLSKPTELESEQSRFRPVLGIIGQNVHSN